MMRKHPKLGQKIVSIYASDNNPRREGIFVEVKHYKRKVNGGTYYRLTDGKGDFWEVEPNDTKIKEN